MRDVVSSCIRAHVRDGALSELEIEQQDRDLLEWSDNWRLLSEVTEHHATRVSYGIAEHVAAWPGCRPGCASN